MLTSFVPNTVRTDLLLQVTPIHKQKFPSSHPLWASLQLHPHPHHFLIQQSRRLLKSLRLQIIKKPQVCDSVLNDFVKADQKSLQGAKLLQVGRNARFVD